MVTPSTISYPIELCLRLTGLWPKSSHTILRRTFCFNAIGVLVMFQYWYIVSYMKSLDLPDLLDALSLILLNSVAFLKFIIIWCNYKIFCNILAIIFDDWNNCALISQYKKLMMDKINLSSRFSNFLASIYGMTCVFYLVSAWLTPDDTGKQLPTNNRKLLLKMQFPFDAFVSPTYEICVIIQIVFQHSMSYLAAMFMALFAALALHVGGQINVICQELADFSPDDEKSSREKLICLFSKHQRIIHLSDQIRYIFTYIAFIDFFAHILVLCSAGFAIVITSGKEDQLTILTKYIPTYIAINFAAFILCYTGEYLLAKSRDLDRAAYNAIWYKLRPREGRMFLIFFTRSKKPLTLTAGKIVDLSVETFASMVKVSASYISALLAVY